MTRAAAWLRPCRTALAAVGDTICPPVCLICGADEAVAGQLCDRCRGRIVRTARQQCPRCGVFHDRPTDWLDPGPTPLESLARDLTSVCRARRPVRRFTTLGVYAGPLRAAVIACKVRRGELLAQGLGTMLGRLVRDAADPAGAGADGALPDVIVPMPMFWLRRWWRGTSGVETVAEHVAAELGRPVLRRALTMTRWTDKQGTLSRSRRRRNVRDAFAVRRPEAVRGRTVLLVDDVITTGATVGEATAALLTAGAAAVDVATLTRTFDGPRPAGGHAADEEASQGESSQAGSSPDGSPG